MCSATIGNDKRISKTLTWHYVSDISRFGHGQHGRADYRKGDSVAITRAICTTKQGSIGNDISVGFGMADHKLENNRLSIGHVTCPGNHATTG